MNVFKIYWIKAEAKTALEFRGFLPRCSESRERVPNCSQAEGIPYRRFIRNQGEVGEKGIEFNLKQFKS